MGQSVGCEGQEQGRYRCGEERERNEDWLEKEERQEVRKKEEGGSAKMEDSWVTSVKKMEELIKVRRGKRK